MKEQGLRLFAEAVVPPRKSTLPPPRLTLVTPLVETTVEPAPRVVARTSIARIAREHEIIAALDQGAAPGERTADAFRRKEHVVGNLFASLSVDDSRSLHRRLTNPTQEDPIAIRMNRLTPERKGRLIAFLGDARRRAALAKGR
jgi:hypothetical protein